MKAKLEIETDNCSTTHELSTKIINGLAKEGVNANIVMIRDVSNDSVFYKNKRA